MRVAGALLWTLGVIQCVLHEAKAASLSVTPSQGSLPLQALEQRDEYDFYQDDGRWCRKCPPGTYVSEHCTHSGAEGKCLPCPDDTFVQHKNQYKACSNCKTCRSDQVELKPCTKTSDTQCACKNGSFCSPDWPCETCHKCTTTRCPDGEVMVHSCTPESDIQCKETSTVTPPTSPTPGAGSIGYSVWIILGVLLFVALLILAVSVYRKRDRESPVNICNSGTIQLLKRKFNLQPSRDPDIQNAQVVPRSQSTDAASAVIPLMEKSSPESRRRLVPRNGRDPVDALRQSFETFMRKVPLNMWKTFMRALDLTDHDIETAEADEKGVNDQKFHMLRTWLIKKGKEATLDTLLDKLCAIELRGVMKSVQDDLISQGLYCYEG